MANENITSKFTKVPNSIMTDTNLSMDARFVMSYICMLPKKWDFSIGGLAASIGVDIKQVAKAIGELEDKLYLMRGKVALGRGKIEWIYVFSTSHFSTVDNSTLDLSTLEPSTLDLSKFDFFEFDKTTCIIQDYIIIQDLIYTRLKEYKTRAKKRKGSFSPPKKTLEERKKDFGLKLQPYLSKYGRDMLTKFFHYWTEHNEKGRKMKFEMQKTFDISGRLAWWADHEKNGFPKNRKGRQSSYEQKFNDIGTHTELRDGSEFTGNPEDYI